MGNEERKLDASGLVVRHVPEPDETYDASAYDDPNHVTGFIDVGTLIDGVFVILARRKASGLFKDIARAKGSRQSQGEQSQGEQSQGEQSQGDEPRSRWPLG